MSSIVSTSRLTELGRHRYPTWQLAHHCTVYDTIKGTLATPAPSMAASRLTPTQHSRFQPQTLLLASENG